MTSIPSQHLEPDGSWPRAAALWEGLFDTRSHVRRYAGSTRFSERRATAQSTALTALADLWDERGDRVQAETAKVVGPLAGAQAAGSDELGEISAS